MRGGSMHFQGFSYPQKPPETPKRVQPQPAAAQPKRPKGSASQRPKARIPKDQQCESKAVHRKKRPERTPNPDPSPNPKQCT